MKPLAPAPPHGGARYPALLDALHAEVSPGRLVAAPSGDVLASPDVLAGDAAADWPPARLGLARVRVPAAPPDAPPDATSDRFAAGLVDLHCRVLRAAIAHALAHLGGRTAEGASLLGKQQIQAALADIAVEIRECEAGTDRPGRPGRRSRWARHRRLTDAGRDVLHLLGASSMLADGPGADLHLAELVGNVYLHPGDGDDID